MGCITSNPAQKTIEWNLGQSEEKVTQPHLDLPYRHYINKNCYIPSTLPHSLIKYDRFHRVRLQSIDDSSIMARRYENQIYSSEIS